MEQVVDEQNDFAEVPHQEDIHVEETVKETTEEKKNPNEDDGRSEMECAICLDRPNDPVVSMCGHLFCWPCLHQWLNTRPNRQVCPVCKAAIDAEKVIPIYGRGGSTSDPRKKTPPRPRGQRTEETSSPFGGFNLFEQNGLQFSIGIGFFPITFFTNFFNLPGAQEAQPLRPNSQEARDAQTLGNFTFYFGLIFIIWLFLSS
uniref:RING-type E3 ubiquitin transferase n=1 Tax=Rhabditophanes sp. KR3021 TaxID=114890 RepID=A0AC35TIS2_9BILA